jgi:hypothetical protein
LREEKVLATGALGDLSNSRLHHLAQSLVPIARCCVFLLGLSALTFTMLRGESWMREIGIRGVLPRRSKRYFDKASHKGFKRRFGAIHGFRQSCLNATILIIF